MYFLCCPTHITAVFSILIFSPCFPNASFHSPSTSCISYPLSTTTIRSSTYSILTFLLTSYITIINMSGLRVLPCLKPMFTLNSSDIPGPTKTLPFVHLYIPSTNLISSTSIHLSVAITISLGAAAVLERPPDSHRPSPGPHI